MQVVFSSYMPQQWCYYTVSQQGIQGVPSESADAAFGWQHINHRRPDSSSNILEEPPTKMQRNC
jgi:hypothetical protein